MYVLNVANLISLRNFQENYSFRLKLSYYFQEAKCKKHLYTLLLSSKYSPFNQKGKQSASKEIRMKYFEIISRCQDISKEQKTASSFYNFSPILLQVPVLNKNPPWKTFPSKTSCHELDIGHFYSSCFWSPPQSYRAPSILYVKSRAINHLKWLL